MEGGGPQPREEGSNARNGEIQSQPRTLQAKPAGEQDSERELVARRRRGGRRAETESNDGGGLLPPVLYQRRCDGGHKRLVLAYSQ